MSELQATSTLVESSEQLFRLLVEAVEDYAIFALDPQGRIATWNTGAQRIKGYRADEIIGRHFSVFYPESDVRAGKCEHELEVAAREGRFEDEDWRVRKDGTRFWANVVISAIRDAEGRLVGFAKVTRDLTARRRAEEERLRLAKAEEASHAKDAFLERERSARAAAEEARSSLATTLRSIGDGVITTDARGCVTMVNPVAEALTGWLDAEAHAQPLRRVFAIVNEQTRREVESPVERVLREGVVVGLANHTVLLRRSGGETPIADSGAPIRDSDGNVHGVVLVFRDASAERREELHRGFLVDVSRALSSSLDYKLTLAKVAEIAVPQFADWCVVDLLEEGAATPARVAVAHVNRQKLALAQEWAAKYPRDWSAPRGAPNVIRTGRAEIYPDIRPEMIAEEAADDERRRLLASLNLRSAVVVPIGDGVRVRGAMTLVYAESGRKYSEHDLFVLEEVGRRAGVAIENARLYAAEQRAREEADAASRAKDEFLAAVSHELRTPLNAILGWAKMLVSPGFDESRRGRAAETIERNAVAMAQLIEDLLDVSRIISGKMRLDVARIDVVTIVEAALESVRPAVGAKDIHVERVFDVEDARVQADGGRLQQVVWNLLSNAVKFTPPGGRVTVGVRRSDSTIEISVTDTGKGIPEAFLPHVFEPFRQAESGASRSTGGLGLGLAITRHLVELHGGRVFATSPGPGHGAAFTVRLPVSGIHASSSGLPRTTPVLSGSPQFEPLPQLRGVRVLVVDDDEDARHLVEAVLEACGSIVTTASGVDEALDAVAREMPDLVVSDIAMPGKDGLEHVRALRARPANAGGNVPAVALTAYTRAEDRKAVLSAGYDVHVPKPIDPAELVSAVAASLRATPTRSLS